jgi:hypothetical protein
MSDKLQFVGAFGSGRVAEISDKLKPESTDKDMKNAVSINNHGLSAISGFHPLSESAAMYRGLSSLRKSMPVAHF